MSRYAWRSGAVVVPASMLVLLFAGCAKEPATTMALAPAPGGASGASASDDGSGGPEGRGSAGVMGADMGRGNRGPQGVEAGAGSGGDAASGFSSGSAAGSAASGGGAGQSMVAAARPEPKQFKPVTALEDIHFDFDKYNIRPEDAQILSANAGWLREHPRSLILIEGHCDDRGTNEYNLALGNHRAEAAMKYLVAQGVPGNRITTISYGEERPLCAEETEECWAKNRRAHFLVRRQ